MQTGAAPPAASEAGVEAVPEVEKRAMEITGGAVVASPVKEAAAAAVDEIGVTAVAVDAGSEDSDFAPPRLTKRPSRRGEQ